MSHPRKVYLLACLAGALAAQPAFAADYVPGEVIVKYRDGASRDRAVMNEMYGKSGVKSVKRYKGMMSGLEQLKLDDSVKVEDAIAELMRNDEVEYAQPNYILTLPRKVDDEPVPGLPGGAIPCIPGFDIPGCDPSAKLPCLIPGIPFPPGCEDGGDNPFPGNPGQPPAQRPDVQAPPAEIDPPVVDPNVAKTYGMNKIQAPEAWAQFRGSKDFVVAVIDTGIDYNHEDLAFNVWRNPTPGPKNDVVGYDFVHDDGLPFDDNEHGTHTSGTVGAVGGNGKGVSGVAQHVKIMGLKFLSGSGSGTTADAIKAIDYAVEHGAKVLSNSWGGKGDDGNAALKESIERAKARDVLFIAAAGNDGTSNDGNDPSYPAAFDNDNLISVAATDEQDKMAFFSNYGTRTTHVAAPGANVYSTTPGNKYASHSGTSMACPHVAGAAAMIWAKNPTWNYKQVKDALINTVDKIPALAGKVSSGGRINVFKALQ